MDEKRLVIIGAGWHGGELYSYVRELIAAGEPLRLLGFVDEQRPAGPWGTTQVIGNFNDLGYLLAQDPHIMMHYITATGNNKVREAFVRKVDELALDNLVPWTLHHPRAAVGYDNEIGEGTCLAPGSVVTTRARIGKHCIVNVNASISHDCTVGDFSNINPGVVLAGNVCIGRSAFIGAGATVIDKISIGENTIVGAGAVVIRNLPDNVTAVGVPARVTKRNPNA